MLENTDMYGYSKIAIFLVYIYTWISYFDIESITNEDISCGKVAMNEPMLSQEFLYRKGSKSCIECMTL